MIARTFALASGVVALGFALLGAFTRADSPPTAAPSFTAGEFTLTGPFMHENLTVYLIHGPDRIKGKHYMTLQEALQDKIVVVHETGNVNELQIENVSSDVDVYIQSGDIVKGGRQDRTIAMDVIIPPKSGVMPLNAFCVEHGRWSKRGGEDSALFAGSNNQVAGKSLKIAVQRDASQSEVWRNVKANQDKLSSNARQSVADPQSATSFQLTLENKKVVEETDAYSKRLASIINGQADVIGYTMVINGKVASADVYASHELFAKLWPRLLSSAAVEAFAEVQKDKMFEPARSEAVKAAIEDADKAKATSKDVTARVELVTRESKDNIVFETRDRQASPAAASANWVHRSYLSKEGYVPAAREMDQRQRQIRTPVNQRANDRQQQEAPQVQPPQQQVNPPNR
jgi:hypothetical protein